MPRVVFVCGAAKAGTSWLYEQFRAHPGCRFRSIKELHYFDALERGKLAEELAKHEGYQSALERRLARTGETPTRGQAEKMADRAAWMDVLRQGERGEAAYLDYLLDGADEGQVVGDVTPAYALLPEARLRRMAKLAPDVRFVLVLRDPVERLWSHVRMMAARRDPEGRVTPDRARRILRRTLRGEENEIEIRSDYAGTLARMGGALTKGRLHLEVFEEMVAGPGLRRIYTFMGLPPLAASGEVVHRGDALPLPAEDAIAAFRWLRPQYVAAREALGRLPGDWRRA